MFGTSASYLRDLLQAVTPGYKSADDEFFTASNKALLTEFKKLGVLVNEVETHEESISKETITIDCNVPGCLQTFHRVQDYQSHYNSAHKLLCFICKKNLPTPHLLDLHISESHDSFFLARVERGERMYACYLEECEEMLSTPTERKKHCIEIHKFPSNFRFDQITTKKSTKTDHKIEVDKSESVEDAKLVSAFTFGHNTDRCFNKKCTRRPAGATLENLNSLKDALEEQ